MAPIQQPAVYKHDMPCLFLDNRFHHFINIRTLKIVFYFGLFFERFNIVSGSLRNFLFR
jgi:hypothetical protein